MNRGVKPLQDDSLLQESSKSNTSIDGRTQGEKLQKFLAQAGFGSRRLMEEWIAAGRVTVNGNTATLGMRIGEGDLIRG